MAWTETTRARHEQPSGRHACDLISLKWALVTPIIAPSKATGQIPWR